MKSQKSLILHLYLKALSIQKLGQNLSIFNQFQKSWYWEQWENRKPHSRTRCLLRKISAFHTKMSSFNEIGDTDKILEIFSNQEEIIQPKGHFFSNSIQNSAGNRINPLFYLTPSTIKTYQWATNITSPYRKAISPEISRKQRIICHRPKNDKEFQTE